MTPLQLLLRQRETLQTDHPPHPLEKASPSLTGDSKGQNLHRAQRYPLVSKTGNIWDERAFM